MMARYAACMHSELAQVLTDAVEANVRANDALARHLTVDMMAAVTPGGGFTVAQHLAHMAGATKFWLSQLDDGASAPLPDLYDTADEVNFVADTDPARVGAALRATWLATLPVVLRADGRGSLPHPSAAQFLMHMLVHDAHHRGQVLLALKTHAFPLPDDAALWRDAWRGGA